MKNLLIVCFMSLLFLSCADAVSFKQASEMLPVGFIYGVWHGMLLAFSWIVSLFNDNTAIYAIYNNGGWYDFGYIFGASGGVGIFIRGIFS